MEGPDLSSHQEPRTSPRRRSRGPVIAGVAVLVVVVVAALGLAGLLRGTPDSAPTPSPTTGGPAPSTACTGKTDAVKPVLKGLLTLNRPPVPSSPLPVAGWSLNVPWSVLQPVAGGPIVHPNPIDEALQTLDARGCTMGVKLRVLAGTSSPEWAKQLGGPPVAMKLVSEGKSGTVPRFWTDAFGSAYDDLQTKLAAEYDATGGIRENVVARCTTFYAEPMLRQVNEASNLAALTAAGWNQATDLACFRAQTDAHTVWKQTPSSLALNPYTAVTNGVSGPEADEDPKGDLTVPLDAAAYCRQVLGGRCILANNSIRWPLLSNSYDGLYARMQKLGGPFEFQAAAPARVGDPVKTLEYALQFGASSVELSPGIASRDAAKLTTVARGLAGEGS